MKAEDEKTTPSPQYSRSESRSLLNFVDDDDYIDDEAPAPQIRNHFSLLGNIIRRQIYTIEHDEEGEAIGDVSDDKDMEPCEHDHDGSKNPNHTAEVEKPTFRNSLRPFAKLLQRQIDRLRFNVDSPEHSAQEDDIRRNGSVHIETSSFVESVNDNVRFDKRIEDIKDIREVDSCLVLADDAAEPANFSSTTRLHAADHRIDSHTDQSRLQSEILPNKIFDKQISPLARGCDKRCCTFNKKLKDPRLASVRRNRERENNLLIQTLKINHVKKQTAAAINRKNTLAKQENESRNTGIFGNKRFVFGEEYLSDLDSEDDVFGEEYLSGLDSEAPSHNAPLDNMEHYLQNDTFNIAPKGKYEWTLPALEALEEQDTLGVELNMAERGELWEITWTRKNLRHDQMSVLDERNIRQEHDDVKENDHGLNTKYSSYKREQLSKKSLRKYRVDKHVWNRVEDVIDGHKKGTTESKRSPIIILPCITISEETSLDGQNDDNEGCDYWIRDKPLEVPGFSVAPGLRDENMSVNGISKEEHKEQNDNVDTQTPEESGFSEARTFRDEDISVKDNPKDKKQNGYVVTQHSEKSNDITNRPHTQPEIQSRDNVNIDDSLVNTETAAKAVTGDYKRSINNQDRRVNSQRTEQTRDDGATKDADTSGSDMSSESDKSEDEIVNVMDGKDMNIEVVDDCYPIGNQDRGVSDQRGEHTRNDVSIKAVDRTTSDISSESEKSDDEIAIVMDGKDLKEAVDGNSISNHEQTTIIDVATKEIGICACDVSSETEKSDDEIVNVMDDKDTNLKGAVDGNSIMASKEMDTSSSYISLENEGEYDDNTFEDTNDNIKMLEKREESERPLTADEHKINRDVNDSYSESDDHDDDESSDNTFEKVFEINQDLGYTDGVYYETHKSIVRLVCRKVCTYFKLVFITLLVLFFVVFLSTPCQTSSFASILFKMADISVLQEIFQDHLELRHYGPAPI